MDSKSNKIALLVDGDNAPSKILEEILDEAAKYGKVNIRRIYGDWTKPQMNQWKKILNEMAFSPIQKFTYTSGKNSTDSALIIDAMDILHDGVVDGFCIVSSDSDYTGLAKRIREEGVFVMGIGEEKTPVAFVKSCEVFTYIENLDIKSENEEKKTKKEKAKRPPINKRLINKAFDMSTNDNDDAYVSTLGSNLRKLDPTFDVRAYGCRTLTQFFEKMNGYEVKDNYANGINYPIVSKKQ